MRLFYKNKGTISVFLTLILLPVLLVGGMTTDAARIYMSKVVVSDAGEMAMNAGLARYNEKLHDEYGLLVMDQSPEAMTSNLEAYFKGSLSGEGLPGQEDYDKILDLMTEKFEALNVVGSEIYRTEVEKQQILEYMKYRAPVCLTELVIEKISQLKDTKKMAEAMEAEMDFSEDMKECQDAFGEALQALDVLNQRLEAFQEDKVKEELENTEKDYKEDLSRYLLIKAEIGKYKGKLSQSESDVKASAEEFIKAAKRVDLALLSDKDTFAYYITSMYYKNTIDDLGGIEKIYTDNGMQEAEAAGSDEGEGKTDAGNSGTEGIDRSELDNLVREYNEQVNRIAVYPNLLSTAAKEKIVEHTDKLVMYRDLAKAAEDAAKAANEKLDEVNKKLKDAKKSFENWDTKNAALKSVGKNTESKDQEVEDYRDFFSGEGQSDLEELERLVSVVKQDEKYFKEWKEELEKEKFFGKSIVKTEITAQFDRYQSRAESMITGKEEHYSAIENVRQKYITNYEHTEGAYRYSKQPIRDDPFYKKLREYCNAQNETHDAAQEKEANDRLDQSKTAGEEAKKQENFPEYNWTSYGKKLPSFLVGSGASEASDHLTDLGSGGNVKDNQKDVISKFKQSIGAAVSFMDAVDRIVAKGAENLYIAEYAMQLFSYYTVGMADGQDRPEGEIIGISGYSLKEHEAYRAECEYILWGKEQSQVNVGSTIMMIFGIRMLFNAFYAFTDKTINATADAAATAIAGGWAPYLVPVIKVVIKLGYAGVEAGLDISKIKQGYGVTIFKDSDTWALSGGDNTSKVTFDYSEYLRVFLNISMLAGNEVGILGRIADCIQVNELDINLEEGYTMIAIKAEVKSRTTFMRKISDWGESGTWGFPDDTYTIPYQSVMGY